MRVLALVGLLVLAGCNQPAPSTGKADAPIAKPEADPSTAAQAPDAPLPPVQTDTSSPEKAHATAARTQQVKAFLRLDDPAFDKQPAAIFSGALAAARPQGADRQFVTRITEDSAAAGVNFAGYSTIVRVGCGTGCSIGWVVDRKTGTVRDLGLGGEEQSGVELVFKPDSRLLKAGWEQDAKCRYQSFLWTGEKLQPVGEALVFDRSELDGYCPRSDD